MISLKTKIIKANKKTKYLNEKYLMEFLSRKFLIVLYFQIKRRNYQSIKAIFSKYLYIGVCGVIKWKLR